MAKNADHANGIWLLDNPIMTYAWGSYTAIPELLNKPLDAGKPQAEMWIGAHPKASSLIRGTDPPLSLAELIRQFPDQILGKPGADAFGNQLPFLLKVLAAREPLSIQVHPDRAAARKGYETENRLGISLTQPERNFRDPNPKPECICALTPLWGLCGFRPLEQLAGLLKAACPALGPRLAEMGPASAENALRRFFAELLRMPTQRQRLLIDQALAWQGLEAESRWMAALARGYPGDIGILFPLLLNLFCLQPGQALFLAPGTLHAYLEGVGVEVMANSDNVIRAGLTPKHKDIETLLTVVDFSPSDVRVLDPVAVSQTEAHYITPAREFRLAVIRVAEKQDHACRRRGGCELLLCTRGQALIQSADRDGVVLAQGDAALIGDGVGGYTLSGDATVYTAAAPVNQPLDVNI